MIYKLVLSIICMIALTSFINAQEKNSYKEFLETASEEFLKSAEKINEEYKIGTYARWHVNQNTGELIFSDNGVPKVIAKVQIAGSYSNISNTWKWSWDNKSVLDSIKKDIDKVRAYGEKNKFSELTTSMWECDEEYAWTMTAAAGYLLKAKGGYRGPTGNSGYAYFVITNIKWANSK